MLSFLNFYSFIWDFNLVMEKILEAILELTDSKKDSQLGKLLTKKISTDRYKKIKKKKLKKFQSIINRYNRSIIKIFKKS